MSKLRKVPAGPEVEWLEDPTPEHPYGLKFPDPKKLIFPPIPPLRNPTPLAPPLADAGFRLRAITKGDEAWLMDLYAASRWHEIEPVVDWTEDEKHDFLKSQAGMQHMGYLKAHPEGDFAIIEREGLALARLYIDHRPTEIMLIDIMVAPVAQRQGLGSWLVRSLQEEGYRTDKPITLHVEARNRAVGLYKGLGFREVGLVGAHLKMIWNPVPLAPVGVKTH